MSSAAGIVMRDAKKTERSEFLVMANLSFHRLDEWVKAMQGAGQPWTMPLISDLTQAKNLLQSEQKCYVLFCIDSPEQHIANEIGLGRTPSQALANWQNWAEALLELYRDYYHRITLVGYAGLYHDPQALCEQLTKRSGIALGRVPVEAPAKIPLEPYEQQQLTTHLLLAQQALMDSTAQRLANELEISSLPLLEKEALIDRLDSLFIAHQALLTSMPKFTAVDYEKLVTRVESLEQEKKTWLQEKECLMQVVEEKCKAKLGDLQQENDMVIQQLHKTQEELEQYILGNKGSGVKLEKLERSIKQKNEKLHAFSKKNKQLVEKLGQAKQEIKAIRQSKSWKLTAPLRRIIKLFGG